MLFCAKTTNNNCADIETATSINERPYKYPSELCSVDTQRAGKDRDGRMLDVSHGWYGAKELHIS